MNYLKKIGFSFGYMCVFFLASLFLLTLLHYFNFFGSKTVNIGKLLFFLISLFIGGFFNGKQSQKNGWFEGLKFALLFIILLTFFNICFSSFQLNVKTILFSLMSIGTITLGSMVGINKNKENKK